MTQSMSAREFRDNMAETMDKAARGNEVIITKHNREHVVVVSMDAYRALLAYEEAEDIRISDERLANPSGPYVPMAEVLADKPARSA